MRTKFLKSMLNEKCGLGGNGISRNGKVYPKNGRREDSCQLSTILVLGLNVMKVAMQWLASSPSTLDP